MVAATVIIATRNRAALLKNCLDSLREQSARGQFEIIVVDNGSSDETSSVVASYGAMMPELRLLQVSEPNRAKARNAGIATARGKWIIFCDDDTILPAPFVAAHLRSHERHDPCVVTGPIINIADPSRMNPPEARHYSRAYFCTCNASVATADVVRAGGFDEQYDLYGWEDTDLGIRLRSLGLPRIFDWQAYLYHHKPAAADSYARRRTLAIEKGNMAARFVRKAPTWPVKLATGAYAANFIRAAVVNAPPMRKVYERIVQSQTKGSALQTLATEALLDAAYLDALKAALRATRD